jgi:surface protein
MMKVTLVELKDMILKGKDISNVDYSHIQDMSYMFSGCYKLKTVPEIDTSKVTRMDYMFSGCKSLEFIDPWNFPDYNWNNTRSDKLRGKYPELFI